MELLVLNTKLEAVAILDNFESLIWTDRYCGYGDFEIYTQATTEFLSYMVEDYYLWLSGSEHIMIIEGADIKSDNEKGNSLIITGRSLESIIDRRIIWFQTALTGNFQNGIKQLLDENVISPSIADRVISNFVFEVSTDPVILALTIDAQYTWDNLYTVITNLCAANNIGYKITLSSDNKFVFKLYAGIDRSYNQFANPYVIFSPKFENIANSDYAQSKKALRTVTMVAGEGEGAVRKTTTVGSGLAIDRREVFTDAKSVSQTVDEVKMTDADYLVQLTTKGTETLSGCIITQAFQGEADLLGMFKYGTDFFMGDIVQIESEYGITSKSRVTDLISSQSTSGITVYPTFTMIDVNQVSSDGVLTPGIPTPIPTGEPGPQGIPGVKGDTGATGPQGIPGPIGLTGVKGDIGLTGSQGIQGPIGLTGSQGIQGPIGLTGAQGIQGPQGIAGTSEPIIIDDTTLTHYELGINNGLLYFKQI